MQWALIRELRSYMLLAWPEKKKKGLPRPPLPRSKYFWGKRKKTGQSRKAGAFLVSSHTFGDPEFGHPALQPRVQQDLRGVVWGSGPFWPWGSQAVPRTHPLVRVGEESLS